MDFSPLVEVIYIIIFVFEKCKPFFQVFTQILAGTAQSQKWLQMAVLSHFWGFFLVTFCYDLEKSPYFPSTMWRIFGRFVHCLFCGLFVLCASL
ncbi:MAG: hypothetical protein ACLRWC_12825, partial [Acutalibacter sp.]